MPASRLIHSRTIIAGGVALLLAVLALSAAALLTSSRVKAGAGPTVSMEDNEFVPASITIDVGDTLTWTNNGLFPHTATADDGTFDSGQVESGESYQFTFETAGTFPYHCQNHGGPGGQGMSGEVIVQGPVQTSPPPTTAPTAPPPTAPPPTAPPTATAPGATPTPTTPVGFPSGDAPSASPPPVTSILDGGSGSNLWLVASASLVVASAGGLLFATRHRRRDLRSG